MDDASQAFSALLRVLLVDRKKAFEIISEITSRLLLRLWDFLGLNHEAELCKALQNGAVGPNVADILVSDTPRNDAASQLLNRLKSHIINR